MPAVAGVVPIVAMTWPLVRVGPLGPLIPIVVALLLVFPGVVRAFPRAAPRPRGAPAARFPLLGGGVLVALGLFVAPHLGAFVSGTAVVELPRGRIAAASRATVRFGAAGRGVALALPLFRSWRP